MTRHVWKKFTKWVNIKPQTMTLDWDVHLGIFKNNIRINVIYNDVRIDGTFIEKKYSDEFKFETA